MTSELKLLATVGVIALLAGCGGGSDGSVNAPDPGLPPDPGPPGAFGLFFFSSSSPSDFSRAFSALLDAFCLILFRICPETGAKPIVKASPIAKRYLLRAISYKGVIVYSIKVNKFRMIQFEQF